MTEHDKIELRKFALDQATKSAGEEHPKNTVTRAKLFYDFLKGDCK